MYQAVNARWPLAHYFRLLLSDCSLRHRHSNLLYGASANFEHNIVFEFHRVTRTYVGVLIG